jgi:dihydrofolate reductase
LCPGAKEDMTFFRNYTLGKTIIMGYETWKSLGKPLPNREHIVISRTQKNENGATFYTSIEEAIKKHPNGIIIGGVEIIREVCIKHMDKIDEVIINRFNESFPATKYLDIRIIPLLHKEIQHKYYTQLRYFKI